MLYRVYKVLGLLPDAVREAIYAAEEYSVIGNKAHARPPLYLS